MFDTATIVKAAQKIEPNARRYTAPLISLAIGSVLVALILLLSAKSVLSQVLICLIGVAILYLIRRLGLMISRQEEAQRIATTLDAIADVHWEWDLKDNIFIYHGRLPELLAYSDDVGSYPEFWKHVIHPVDRPLQKYHLLQHLDDETIPYFCEYRLKDSNGDYQWFAARGKVILRDEQDNPLKMVGSLEHIQTRKDLEERLIHAHKMEALGQLTGGIAHDFNNVLASLLGYTELALDSPVDPEIKRYLEQIHQAGSRARNVVRQLLDFSRTPMSETQVVMLKDEMQEAVEMLRISLPSTIKIEESYPESSCEVRLDPNQLQRVLLNLGINARDAMNSKGNLFIQLETETLKYQTCSSCQDGFEGDYHILRVRDDGEGFDETIRHKLFEPFFTTKELGKGTGMGLSVVHGIVHDYDGHIRLNNIEESGTEICLYFPRLEQTAEIKPAADPG